MSELQPCPFCGGPAVLEDGGVADTVACEWCGCQTNGAHLNAEEATAAWNRRASGWISVEERVPGGRSPVLVLYGGCGAVSVGRYESAGGVWTSELDLLADAGSGIWAYTRGDLGPVTHWRLCPTPPAGEPWQAVTRWISVEERLPEVGKVVMVWLVESGKGEKLADGMWTEGYHNGETWCSLDEIQDSGLCTEYEEVTHWQFGQDPPTEEVWRAEPIEEGRFSKGGRQSAPSTERPATTPAGQGGTRNKASSS